MKKICIAGTHGVGKTTICERVFQKVLTLPANKVEILINSQDVIGANFRYIPEQYREVMNELKGIDNQNSEAITLSTYYRQAYLESLYEAQGKNILCDRSVLDAFVYYDYFNNFHYKPITFLPLAKRQASFYSEQSYSKIYLIEPSDREIENDGFRMTDKKQQLEIHDLFLLYFKNRDFDNVEIINQEEAHKPEFIERVVKEFNV